MSKFCGVISTQDTCKLEYPLQFLFLEIIADWLINETHQLHADFERKSMGLLEQQDRILTNERDAIGIHQQLETINGNLFALEEEIHQNDLNLVQMEKTITALENLYPDTHGNPLQPHCKSNYEELLEMIEKTDHEIMFLQSIMEEIGDYQKCIQLKVNPYMMISSILDCHNNILMQTESNIHKLLDKTAEIEIAFQNTGNNVSLNPACNQIFK